MNISLITGAALAGMFLSVNAYADTGELWEITTKMDMPGMGFSMPETTNKVCLAKGAEKDPKQTASKDCETTDVKTVGNKTTWKAKCTDHGNVMDGTGEIVSEKDGYHGTMHITGKADGKPMEMNQTYRGKRLGDKCDTTPKACDPAQYDAQQLVGASEMFLAKKPACPGKEKTVCETIRKDTAKLYVDILNHDKSMGSSDKGVQVAKACSLNMEEARKTVCAERKSDLNFLKEYCPAEYKAHLDQLEQARLKKQKECAGLDYTSSGGKCGSPYGASSSSGSTDSSSSSAAENSAGQKSDSGQAGSSATGDASSGNGNPADAVIDSAKKLKGLLGF